VAKRLESLDVFRGLTIAAMILVSTPGTWDAVYPLLEHAAWDGWTPTDLVFPFLLFAMGAAVPFAMSRRRGTGRQVRRHVIRRALVLIALGLILNAIETPPPVVWSTFRIPGVLQRIALVYIAVAALTERT
jgi:predicted acyltransferase